LPPLQLPEGVFESTGGALPAAVPETLDRIAGSLLQARREVDDYVVGMAQLGNSQEALQSVDRLRGLLEQVYDATVTFRGEERTTGPRTTYIRAENAGVVGSHIEAKYIAGHDINIEHR
jgi:hypothetical protein